MITLSNPIGPHTTHNGRIYMFTVIYETINGQRITRTVSVQALLNKVINSIHNNGGIIITVERKG